MFAFQLLEEVPTACHSPAAAVSRRLLVHICAPSSTDDGLAPTEPLQYAGLPRLRCSRRSQIKKQHPSISGEHGPDINERRESSMETRNEITREAERGVTINWVPLILLVLLLVGCLYIIFGAEKSPNSPRAD